MTGFPRGNTSHKDGLNSHLPLIGLFWCWYITATLSKALTWDDMRKLCTSLTQTQIGDGLWNWPSRTDLAYWVSFSYCKIINFTPCFPKQFDKRDMQNIKWNALGRLWWKKGGNMVITCCCNNTTLSENNGSFTRIFVVSHSSSCWIVLGWPQCPGWLMLICWPYVFIVYWVYFMHYHYFFKCH